MIRLIFFDEFGMLRLGWFVISVLVAGFAIIGLILVPITYHVEKNICEAKATEMNVEYQFGLWKGCLIKIDGNWISIDNYRVND